MPGEWTGTLREGQLLKANEMAVAALPSGVTELGGDAFRDPTARA